MTEDSKRMTEDVDQILEALWTSHLSLEDCLTDVIDDLKRAIRELQNEMRNV